MNDSRVETIRDAFDPDLHLLLPNEALTSLAHDLERAEEALERITNRRLGTLDEYDADDFHEIARAYFREKE